MYGEYSSSDVMKSRVSPLIIRNLDSKENKPDNSKNI